MKLFKIGQTIPNTTRTISLFECEDLILENGLSKFDFVYSDQECCPKNSSLLIFDCYTKITFCHVMDMITLSTGKRDGSMLVIQRIKDVKCSVGKCGIHKFTFRCEGGEKYKITAV